MVSMLPGRLTTSKKVLRNPMVLENIARTQPAKDANENASTCTNNTDNALVNPTASCDLKPVTVFAVTVCTGDCGTKANVNTENNTANANKLANIAQRISPSGSRPKKSKPTICDVVNARTLAIPRTGGPGTATRKLNRTA